MVATLSASAQDEDDLVNEIGISYGVVANSNFLDIYTDAMTGKSGTYFGPLALEYFHHLCPMVSLGGIGVYKSHKETINGIELTNSYYTIMPAVKFSWYTSIPYSPLRESKRVQPTRRRVDHSTSRCQPSVLK